PLDPTFSPSTVAARATNDPPFSMVITPVPPAPIFVLVVVRTPPARTSTLPVPSWPIVSKPANHAAWSSVAVPVDPAVLHGNHARAGVADDQHAIRGRSRNDDDR